MSKDDTDGVKVAFIRSRKIFGPVDVENGFCIPTNNLLDEFLKDLMVTIEGSEILQPYAPNNFLSIDHRRCESYVMHFRLRNFP